MTYPGNPPWPLLIIQSQPPVVQVVTETHICPLQFYHGYKQMFGACLSVVPGKPTGI